MNPVSYFSTCKYQQVKQVSAFLSEILVYGAIKFFTSSIFDNYNHFGIHLAQVHTSLLHERELQSVIKPEGDFSVQMCHYVKNSGFYFIPPI